jgi:hypothetical protein
MKRIALFFICISLIVSCKKSTTDNSPSIASIDSTTSVDYLSDEQLQILDNAGIDTTTKFSDFLFPDGTKMIDWETIHDPGYQYIFNKRIDPASDKKKLFMDAMGHAADKLTDKKSYKIITNQENGLAYVYGSRHLNAASVWNPQDPRDGKPALCQTPFFGLDCNGMIYQMATASGINLKEGTTTDYAKVEVWNTAFKDPNSYDFNGLQMTDLSNLGWDLVQAGDIVVSTGKHNHIGMIYNNGKSKGLINSQGSPEYTCHENTLSGRGPRKTSDLAKWVKQLFGENYHILRVVQTDNPGISQSQRSYDVISFERKYHDSKGVDIDVASSGGKGYLTLIPNSDSCTFGLPGAGFNWYLYGKYSGTDVTLSQMAYVDGGYHPLSSPITFSTLDQKLSFTIHIAYYFLANDETYYEDDPVVLEKH